jgi:hypothetical protein
MDWGARTSPRCRRRSAMAVRVRRVALALAVALLLVQAACNSTTPPSGPEATCAQACEARAHGCSSMQCGRGCNLVLDRLAEGEGDRVIACVAKTTAACDDRAWAHCAARVGVHADGGPPAPKPPSDIEEDEE